VSEAPAPAPTAQAASRRRRRLPWIVLGIFVALLVGMRVALPTIAARGTAWGSRYYLGLPARIEAAHFDLLAGRVVLEGITLGARPDGVTPRDAALSPPPIAADAALVQVNRVATELSWRDLRHRTVHIASLAIDGPSVRAARESDGRIDPLRWAQPAAPPSPAEPAPEKPSEPWKTAVDRFEVTTPNVRVVDAPSSKDIIELALEKLALDAIAVKGTELELGGVGIEGPVLRVDRDLLLAKPATPPASAPAAPTPAPAAAAPVPAAPAAASAPAAAPAPSATPGYRVARVDIDRAKFTWITDNGPLDVALTLKATDIRADQGARFPLDLQLEIGDGSMGIHGDVGLVPPAYTGKLQWNGLPMPRILLASVPQFAPWLRQAKSSGDLALDADPTGAKGEPSMRVSGRLSFDALAVQDPKGNEMTLGWQQLEVVMRDVYAPLPQQGKPLGTTKAVLDSVKLVEPKIRYTRPSPQLDALLGINLSGTPGPAGGPAGAPKPSPVTPPPEANGAQAPLDLAIASVEMVNGDVEALDNTVEPTARTRVHDLSLQAKDVAFPAVAVGDVQFRATLPTSAQLEVAGKLAPGNVGDFTLQLRKLDLPVFNPYASAAAGVTVDRGDASADVKLKMRGAKMQIDNKLVLHQLGVSMRDPATFERSFGVPLDLALALLRDPQGNIKLDIPVAMDEKGAKIGIGAVVASALKAALIGAVTAPLKMVGALFQSGDQSGGGGLSIEPLPSVAGEAALDGDQTGRLEGLAKMLGQRPSLALSLRGRVGPEDHPKVAEQILIEKRKAGQDLPQIEGTNILSRRRIGQALDRRGKGGATELDAEDQALYDRYVAAIAVPDERLAALAKSRAEFVRDALVAKGVPTPRVRVGEPESESKPGVVIGFAGS
jgi:uncharacterized protein DUF748